MVSTIPGGEIAMVAPALDWGGGDEEAYDEAASNFIDEDAHVYEEQGGAFIPVSSSISVAQSSPIPEPSPGALPASDYIPSVAMDTTMYPRPLPTLRDDEEAESLSEDDHEAEAPSEGGRGAKEADGPSRPSGGSAAALGGREGRRDPSAPSSLTL
eukprot:GHVU01159301.1.p1 GENE.GHVU01159301.1~~GHVU01159301.1.p1  ORF type:complete len:156 (+),score=29.33 GHVU01159301.1:1436-1903(+)